MRIYLIGMPYAGKTTIAQKLAQKLAFKAIDLDDYIEKKHKTSITDIFSKEGEKQFREYEKNALKEIITHNNIVISTGGGIVLSRENKFLMEGLIIYLDVSLENLERRKAKEEIRPLLKTKSLEELYQERRKYYYFFQTFIVDGNHSVDEVVKKIIKLLKDEDLYASANN
ncbi:MAG: shikimate kinase [Acholeplasmatales bacterium]|jgi:shikimate kinase|nr:shikimate kinase [Acholeplasmataceae bacterium]MDY0115205.1 shikimate kinase [Acholeplasmatales bacterium]MCK9233678.1 shikimate kinase [Acholeplasmataceae bacterium]MCK9288933.1 shikimate kinase [Acholeplasmataceae bacterium]MCK9427527.1 shikimate kinase [Acholeplasmataceae bacterium]